MVRPLALRGEKTGTYSDIDRTVHGSHLAAGPPGEARSDLDIILDCARRVAFRDTDGKPHVEGKDAAGAFTAWSGHSKGGSATTPG